jgi:hypothetical protein
MNELNLMRSQSNGLLKAIQDAGFSQTEFELSTTSSNFTKYSKIPLVAHTASKYYFAVDYRSSDILIGESWIARYSPGTDHLNEYSECTNWDSMLRKFRAWLKNVVRETEEPDLWSQKDHEQFSAWME